MAPRLVVFDWNGTLLADTRACYAATHEVMRRLGGKRISFSEFVETMDIPVIGFYVRHGVPRERILEDPHAMSSIFHAAYEERAKACRTRGGARELLGWLKGRRIPAVILSNHTVAGIEAQLARLEIRGLVADVLANTALDAPVSERNKELRLERYLRAHKIAARDAVIVGDSPEEIDVGKALGVRTIAIAHGNYATHRLRELSPDHLVGSLRGVQDALRRL